MEKMGNGGEIPEKMHGVYLWEVSWFCECCAMSMKTQAVLMETID